MLSRIIAKKGMKGSLLFLALSGLSLSVNAAAPINTLDLSDIPLTSPDIESQIIPSNSTLVQRQVSAFEQLNLTPDQMQVLKRLNLETERQKASPYINLPTPVVRSLAISLEPGKTPPVIRMSANMLTTINFVDANGDPWPIESVSLNRSQFDDSITQAQIANPQSNQQQQQQQVQQQPMYDKDGNLVQSQQGQQQQQQQNETIKTNILTLFPKNAVAYSNVAITLEGKPLPVILLLASGQPEVDIRVDARMNGISPKSTRDRVSTGLVSNISVDEESLSFLDGVIPDEAYSMMSSNQNVQAWELNDELYVRTMYDVSYPEYNARVGSRDGSRVYKFNGNPTNIVFTQSNGQPVTVSFENSMSSY